MNFFKWFSSLIHKPKQKKIKLGLALGSGGAKGFAELGALSAFEENGIHFDIIAGTSIGSVIGAFYADGYSVTDIFELLKRIDLGEVTNMFMLGMDTSGMYNLIDREIGGKNIEELAKPFKVVATEIESGEERVFDSGNVASALCASSSFPPFFKPVVIGNERFVDGAFTNSIPADLVKGMGADYIVGIDLANHEAKPSLLSRLFPTYKSKIKEPWAKGYEFSDVMLHPDLSDFQATSYRRGKEMFDIGYHHAMSFISKIKQDIDKLKNPTKNVNK